MKAFPIDIWSVKEYGIEAWHKGFFWPVSNEEFQNLRGEIQALYLDTLSESPPDVGDALWVLYSWAYGIAMLFHALWVVQRLQYKGFSIRYHPSSTYYKTLVEGGPIQNMVTKPLPQVPSWREKARGRLRAWLENVKYHGFDAGYYLDRSRRPHYLSVDLRRQSNELFATFATSRGKSLTVVHPRQLMPASLKRTDDLPEARQSVTYLVEDLEAIAARYGIQVEKRHLESLRALLVDSVQYIVHYIQGIRRELQGRECTSILVRALGNTFIRSLCVAGRREGYHIVGFPHGNGVGISRGSAVPYVVLSMADTFAVPTGGAAELFSMSVAQFLHPYGKDVEIVSCESAEYERLKRLNRAQALPSSIKKVMLIEWPLVEYWDDGSHVHFWPYQLDLNLRIATLLRRHGITPILKRHPDRLRESEGVYDPYYDELLTVPFEEVYDEADAYVFPHIGTTTFGFSLLTNKPMIIFESALEDVWEPARELLRKRCRVVPSWVAEDGRLMFDEDKLVDALLEPPEEPNDEFIERYMISGS